MNDLFKVVNGEIKLDSRMIAEHFGKEHKNVLADIRDELEKLNIEGVSTGLIFQLSAYKDTTGRSLPCYTMGKSGALQLAARYDAVSRYKFIKRIDELESSNRFSLPRTFSEALRLAAAQQEEIDRLATEVNYKSEVIEGLLPAMNIYQKRTILNRVVRHKKADFRARWTELYKAFIEMYHIDLKARCEGHNMKEPKKSKHLSVVAYAERFGHLDNLYTVAVKLYETDVSEIIDGLKGVAIS